MTMSQLSSQNHQRLVTSDHARVCPHISFFVVFTKKWVTHSVVRCRIRIAKPHHSQEKLLVCIHSDYPCFYFAVAVHPVHDRASTSLQMENVWGIIQVDW